MALSIEQLRNAFKKQDQGGEKQEGNNGFWDKFYKFYSMDYDETVEFRFLPDADEENPLGFIVENKHHKFNVNGKTKTIACSQMYGKSCACCETSKKFYDAGDAATGKVFWRRIDYLVQGLILKSPFEYPIKADENPVRLLSLGPKLYKVIESKIMAGDMDEMPYDMVTGYNFRINKTKQGEYADYSTSDFARKSSAIPDNLLGNIEMYDIKNYRHTEIERPQMESLIEAYLTGHSYEEDKTVVSSAPSSTGSSTLDASISSPKVAQSAESVVAQIKEVEQPAQAVAGKLSPQEILAKLKARQQAA